VAVHCYDDCTVHIVVAVTVIRIGARSGHSEDGDVEASDDDDDRQEVEVDVDRKRKWSDNAERRLIEALRSLETTLSDHTLQLTRRLRRELTVKGNETQAAVGTAAIPAKTGQRGDKVLCNNS